MNAPSPVPRPFGIPGLSKYVYGTTRLGDAKIPVEDRLKMARSAITTGVWFHASRQYGDALEVLGRAFAENRAGVPRLIFKIGNNNLAELRASIREQLAPLGVDHMDVGQLCPRRRLRGTVSPRRPVLRRFSPAEGVKDFVRNFVMEVFPWTSDAPRTKPSRPVTPTALVDAFYFLSEPAATFRDQQALGSHPGKRRAGHCHAHGLRRAGPYAARRCPAQPGCRICKRERARSP